MGSDDRRNTMDELEHTGTGVDAPSRAIADLVVRDNRDFGRFEVVVDGQTAFLQYERQPAALVILHTEVPESLRGRSIGSLLATTALQSARAERLAIVVRCPFVREYLRRHPITNGA